MNKEDLKILNYEVSVSSLPDYPSDAGYTAQQLKAVFDARSDNEIKEKHNALVDAYAQTEDTASEHVRSKNNPHGVTAAQLGLSNVDNTSDEEKPISRIVQQRFDEVNEALGTNMDEIMNVDSKVQDVRMLLDNQSSILKEHNESRSNPHGVTAAQIGLENVDNTSDEEKPISRATLRFLEEETYRTSPRTERDYAKEHSIGDSANGSFVRLSIIGESKQSGTPDPSNSKEIESIQNPVITVKKTAEDLSGNTVKLEGITLYGLEDFNGIKTYDEIVVEEGKVTLIRKCAVIEDLASQNWITGNTSGVYYTESDAKYIGSFLGSGGICSAYPYGFSGTKNTFNIGSDQISSADRCCIVFNTTFSTVGEFRNAMKDQTLVYQLNTPVETDISETSVGKALLSLKTVYPSTYVKSSADMKIIYATDVAKFFDELQRKISNMSMICEMNIGDISFLRSEIMRLERELA